MYLEFHQTNIHFFVVTQVDLSVDIPLGVCIDIQLIFQVRLLVFNV